jgi:hypothetical protein
MNGGRGALKLCHSLSFRPAGRGPTALHHQRTVLFETRLHIELGLQIKTERMINASTVRLATPKSQ